MTQYRDLDAPARILLGPGPSMVPPRVLRAMAHPLVGHLDPQFIRLMDPSRNNWTQIDYIRVAQAHSVLKDQLEMADVIKEGSDLYPGAVTLNLPVARTKFAEWSRIDGDNVEARMENIKELATLLFHCDISRDKRGSEMYQEVAAFHALVHTVESG